MFTKQNISYPEAEKLVESRTPIAGVSYTTITSKTNQKSHKSIAVQTDNQTNSESANNKGISLKSINKLQIIMKNSDKQTSKLLKILTSLNRATLKFPAQKNPVQNTFCNKQLNTQNSKFLVKKNPSRIKSPQESRIKSLNNSAKKIKKQAAAPTLDWERKKSDSISGINALSLHPTDSDNEEMSTAFELINEDIAI